MSLLFRWPVCSSKRLPEAQSYQDARTAIEYKITPELKHAHDDLIGEAYWLCHAEDRKWPQQQSKDRTQAETKLIQAQNESSNDPDIS